MRWRLDAIMITALFHEETMTAIGPWHGQTVPFRQGNRAT
jgi:hypothetical protein